MHTGAEFDATGCYRYLLWRSWDGQAPRVGFVMLNPSRADAAVNDPTIRRCLGFARTWGFGAMDVVNLFAYCTAQPAVLRQVNDPIGGRERPLPEGAESTGRSHCFGVGQSWDPTVARSSGGGVVGRSQTHLLFGHNQAWTADRILYIMQRDTQTLFV